MGLTEEEVKENRRKYGSNNIGTFKNASFIKKFIESLGDPIIKILLIALAIKLVFFMKNFDWYETIGIVIAIFVASFISSISEYGSEKAFIRLQIEASKIKCKVKREGVLREIPIGDVVVGDVIKLSSGDKVVADGVLISGSVCVDESFITGEAKEIYKEKDDLLYRGSVVYAKEGYMKVCEVGENTVYGKLASELKEEHEPSPLKLRLTDLARSISKIGYIGAFFVSISYLFSVFVIQNNFEVSKILVMLSNTPFVIGKILYALTLCVTVIVVTVPEGLPMMITLVLSSNMKRMLKNNVLVRKLVGIETAGSLNILFTDKTGTLTNGKLEAIGFLSHDKTLYQKDVDIKNGLKKYVLPNLLYNNECEYQNDSYIGGNITDQAILKFVSNKTLEKSIKNHFLFDSKLKYSYVDIDKRYIKGAPEVIISSSLEYMDEYGMKHTFKDKEEVLNEIKKYTSTGIRAVALSFRECYGGINRACFLGVMLLKDEVRKEANKGVDLVLSAGIQTVMITGDAKETAVEIAREVGIYKTGDLVLTSEELSKMSDEKVKEILPKLRVVARALPLDKSRLVRLSKELDLVVGMTGDGVNDAPALKKADVGFAMGSGSEVSKEASDIVILDDNFLSITKSILFGRTIFKSIRKFIIVQLSINFCALSLSIIGPFISIDTPVTVVQMLWINMVMDTLAGLAFAFEPPLTSYMKEKPKSKNEKIMNHYMKSTIFYTSLYTSILCFFFLKHPIVRTIYQSNERLMTAFFGLFIFIDIFNSFNARTTKMNIFSNILSNKVFIFIILFIALTQIVMIYFGGEVFRTTGLTFFELQLMILIASSVILFDWIRKFLYKKRYHKIEL